jgi:tetratricopeptide (TPR) repeat protein
MTNQEQLNKADQLYEEAQQEYIGGDYEVAINLLNQAIELNPSDGWFYYERGQAKDELEDFTAAIEDFTKALSFDPDEDLLGNCLHARANTRFFGLNDKKGACEDWSKAAAMGRENSAEYLREHCQQ